jgi:hypothetical protein
MVMMASVGAEQGTKALMSGQSGVFVSVMSPTL